MNIGTLFRAHAVKNVFGGDAISRVAGEVVFTHGAVAGEDFIGRITAVNKDYARAEIVEITKVSPERVCCLCPGMGRCPGCVYGHMSHAEEQKQKLQQLRDFMQPLGVDAALIEGAGLLDAPEKNYRNKIRLTMRKAGGEAQLGYVFTDGRMYPLQQCLLASKAINAKLAELLNDPGFVPSLHDRMTLTLRESADGVIYYRNSAAKRMDFLREKVLDKDFLVPPDGFFQVNKHGMDTLLQLVMQSLQESECRSFVDAYAGSGLFGSAAASCGVTQVYAVEADERSGEAAVQNYRNYGVKTLDFRAGDAAELLPGLLNEAPVDSTVLFDPPRGGMDGKAVGILNRSSIRNAIYISCHPATLVRDLARLQRGGFVIRKVRMIDMFPRSGHFETFVQLTRQKA